MTDPADFIQAHGPEALSSVLADASDLQAHLAGRTRAMLRQEAEDRGAPLEREALAWLVRHPEDAPEGEGEEQLFTGSARYLLAVCARRSAGRGWEAVIEAAAQALERPPLCELEPRARRGLVDDLIRELDACQAIRRPSKRAVERLVSGVDVRARRVEAALVPVLEAIAAGEPLLDTGERLRAALRAWEGQGL